MSKMEPHNLHNIKRNFEKKTGIRLLPYADNMNSSDLRKKSHPMMAIVSVLLCVVIILNGLAIAFLYLRGVFGANNSADSFPSLPSLSESQGPSNNEGTEDLDETKPTENLNVEKYNLQIVRESNGKEITQTIVVDENHTLRIDALVNTSNVQRISRYAYIPAAITDEQRTALFEAYFGERADEVYHYTYGNANSWKLKTENEDYMFNYGREYGPIDAPLFVLSDDNVQTSAFDRNMLSRLSDTNIALSEAFGKCSFILPALVNDKLYDPDWVRPFPLPDSADNKGFYWITYRRIMDGMPITADTDLRFFISENEVIRVFGVLYEIEELSPEHHIISAEDALKSLNNYAPMINPYNLYPWDDDIFSGTTPISEITLEYLVLRNEYAIAPVWRFKIGETEEQRLMYRDRIIAVNALTGEVIIDRRGIKM